MGHCCSKGGLIETVGMRTLLLGAFFVTSALAQNSKYPREVETVYPDARSLYIEIHQNPELSSQKHRLPPRSPGAFARWDMT
jgi:hypothetical protein